MKMFSPKQTYLVHFLFFLFCWTLPIKAIPIFEKEREKSKTPPADTTLARRNADFNQPLDEQRRGDIFPSENSASLDHEMNIPSSNENGLSPTSAPSAADATYVPPPNDLPAPVVKNSKANGSIFDPTIIHQKASQQAPLHLPSPFAAKASEKPTELETLSAISFPSGKEKALSVLADRYREEGILPNVTDEETAQAITGTSTKHLESVAARIALPKETSPTDADLIAFFKSLPAISFPSGGEKALSVLADRYRQEGILPDVNDEQIVQAITGAATQHLRSVEARIALLKETSPEDTDLIAFLESYHERFKETASTRDVELILKNFKTAFQSIDPLEQYQEEAAIFQENDLNRATLVYFGDQVEGLLKRASMAKNKADLYAQATLTHLLAVPPDLEKARRDNEITSAWKNAATDATDCIFDSNHRGDINFYGNLAKATFAVEKSEIIASALEKVSNPQTDASVAAAWKRALAESTDNHNNLWYPFQIFSQVLEKSLIPQAPNVMGAWDKAAIAGKEFIDLLIQNKHLVAEPNFSHLDFPRDLQNAEKTFWKCYRAAVRLEKGENESEEENESLQSASTCTIQ